MKTISSPVVTVSLSGSYVDRLEHHEQRVVVDLQLGPLVGRQGVLDGERVQPELAA